MECLILHEHHIADFHASDEVLDRWTKVATSSPNILNERDLSWINLECLGEPSEVELNTFIFEEFVIIWVVEYLDAKHDEAGVVAASDADVVQVVEADAELWADQWIGWRVQLSRDAVWLEAIDASSNEVDIISPPSNDRVPLDRRARNSCGREALLVALPGVGVGNLLACLVEPIANERIRAIAIRVTACRTGLISSPEIILAHCALGSAEAKPGEGLRWVELLGVGCKFWTSQCLDFLCAKAGNFFFFGH